MYVRKIEKIIKIKTNLKYFPHLNSSILFTLRGPSILHD